MLTRKRETRLPRYHIIDPSPFLLAYTRPQPLGYATAYNVGGVITASHICIPCEKARNNSSKIPKVRPYGYNSSKMESLVRVPNIANSSKQGMEELDASMPYFADLLRMVPRIPSQMSNLLAPPIQQSPPPDAFILTDQLSIASDVTGRYLHWRTRGTSSYNMQNSNKCIQKSSQYTTDQCNQQPD